MKDIQLLRKLLAMDRIADNKARAIFGKQYALITMDSSIPKLNGYKGTHTIRDTAHLKQKIPINALIV